MNAGPNELSQKPHHVEEIDRVFAIACAQTAISYRVICPMRIPVPAPLRFILSVVGTSLVTACAPSMLESAEGFDGTT